MVCQAGQGGSYTAHTDRFSWLPPEKQPFCHVHTHLPSLTVPHLWLLPLLGCSVRHPEGSVAGSTHTDWVGAMLQDASTTDAQTLHSCGYSKHQSVAAQLHSGHRAMFYSPAIVWTKWGSLLSAVIPSPTFFCWQVGLWAIATGQLHLPLYKTSLASVYFLHLVTTISRSTLHMQHKHICFPILGV